MTINEIRNEYAPKYYVEGIIRANDTETAGDIAEYLYHINAKTVKHIKEIRAAVEGKVPTSAAAPLHIYWYEGIGYAESQIKDEWDAADFNNDYCGTTSNGYNHAVEFNGFFSENDLGGLVWQIKELSKKLGWAMELDGEAGEYSDTDKDCEFELKIESAEDDAEEEIA